MQHSMLFNFLLNITFKIIQTEFVLYFNAVSCVNIFYMSYPFLFFFLISSLLPTVMSYPCLDIGAHTGVQLQAVILIELVIQ